jgi:hypothetical protein
MPSSVVLHIAYNPDQQELTVVFVSGEVYRYKNVPEKVYKDFKAAISKGTFLNRKIKRSFAAEKIESLP